MGNRWFIGGVIVFVALASGFWAFDSSRITTGETVPEVDSHYLAFLHNAGGQRFDLYVLNADNGETTKLTRGQRTHDAQWHPDGEHIYFMADGTPQMLHIHTGELTRTERLHRQRRSPDGRKIAVLEESAELVVEDISGNNPVTLAEQIGFSNINILPAFVDWSADSQQVAFVDRYPTEEDELRFESDITIATADGRETTRIPREGIQTFPLWSPDGQYLALRDDIIGEYEDTEQQDLVLYEVATGDMQKLVEFILRFQPMYWTPDSEQLIYVTSPDICAVTIATGETDCPLVGTDPALHPDGQILAYRGFNQAARHVDLCVGTLAGDETCYLSENWGDQIFPIGWQPA